MNCYARHFLYFSLLFEVGKEKWHTILMEIISSHLLLHLGVSVLPKGRSF